MFETGKWYRITTDQTFQTFVVLRFDSVKLRAEGMSEFTFYDTGKHKNVKIDSETLCKYEIKQVSEPQVLKPITEASKEDPIFTTAKGSGDFF